MIDTFPCPRCGRRLPRSGEVEIEGTTFPVFLCNECMTHWTVEGGEFDVAYTFAVDAEGKPFDPAAEDGNLPL